MATIPNDPKTKVSGPAQSVKGQSTVFIGSDGRPVMWQLEGHDAIKMEPTDIENEYMAAMDVGKKEFTFFLNPEGKVGKMRIHTVESIRGGKATVSGDHHPTKKTVAFKPAPAEGVTLAEFRARIAKAKEVAALYK
jgi:hypothetical protein